MTVSRTSDPALLGPTGPTGPTGAAVTGPTGPTGATGPTGPEVGTSRIATFADQKTSGTNGGTFTGGSYQTRTLQTTITNGISGCSLSSNQVTLPAGTYYVHAYGTTGAAATQVGYHKLRLQNVTDATTLLIGVNAISSSAASARPATSAFLEGVFTLSASKAVELQHRCATTVSTEGFGTATSFGDDEVYASITFIKLS